MCVLEFKPLMVEVFAAVKGFVGAICIDGNTESFPGSVILVTKWYGEELVIRVGVF